MDSASSLPDLGTVLSVWAHPDDETWLAAGLMAAARDRGRRVVCVSATAGEHGTPDPLAWPPERLGRVRRWESAAAMAVLGVDEHDVLGLPDGGLADHDAEGTAWVGGLVDEVEPDTILTFGPDGMTFHPDHIAVHRWVTAAWAERGHRSRLLMAATTTRYVERFRPLQEQWGVYMTDERPRGVTADEVAVGLALEGAALDRKLSALRAMATQTADLFATVDLPVLADIVAEETFVEAPPSSR